MADSEAACSEAQYGGGPGGGGGCPIGKGVAPKSVGNAFGDGTVIAAMGGVAYGCGVVGGGGT